MWRQFEPEVILPAVGRYFALLAFLKRQCVSSEQLPLELDVTDDAAVEHAVKTMNATRRFSQALSKIRRSRIVYRRV
jgi:NADP-dependent 3-hydroxy acid dehydrogenase YdfG